MRTIQTVDYPSSGIREVALFLLKVAIGVLAALISAFFVLLASNAPSLSPTPFAGIAIEAGKQTVHLPNQIFNCTDADQQFQCSATVEDRSLNLTWQQSGDFKSYNLSKCEAVLSGKPIKCTQAGANYIGRKGLLPYYKLTGTGLSYSQLQGLRQQYLWVNALAQVGRDELLKIVTGIAAVTGVIAVGLVWLYPGRLADGFASFVTGLGAYHLVGRWLGSVEYDWVSVIGISPGVWNWIVPGLALVAALLTGLSTAGVLWVHPKRRTITITSLISSFGIFGLVWYALIWLAIPQSVGALTSLGIAIAIGLLTIFLLRQRTERSLTAFLLISSGFGAFCLLWTVFLFSMLELGYVN